VNSSLKSIESKERLLAFKADRIRLAKIKGNHLLIRSMLR